MKILIPFLVLGVLVVGSALLDQPTPRADLVASYRTIETLDPQVTRASEDVRMAYALFEGLCTFDPYTLDVLPGVAERWEVDEDYHHYVFHLRDDAGWSDGVPVTAHDFAYAWRVGLLPDTAPPYMKFLHYLKGGEAFTDWATESLAEVRAIPGRRERLDAARARREQIEQKFAEMVGVEVVDDHTLVVEAEEPVPYFLEILATWPLFPLPEHVVEPVTTISEHTGMIRRDPAWIKAGRMVNNGPFFLADWRFKREIYMQRNPHYWGRENVALDSIQFLNFSDHTTIFIAYESGLIDLAIGVEPLSFMPDLIEAQRRGDRNDVHLFDGFGTYYYAFNVRENVPGLDHNPMTDLRVRKALNKAIDKTAIVERVTRMHQTPATTFVPPDAVADYTSPEGLGRDPDRARELLADAGYPGGDGFPRMTLLYNTEGGHQLIAQAVASMWRRELGIEMRLEGVEWGTYLNRREQGDFHIARGGWFGDYTDPTTFLDLFRPGNPHNTPGLEDQHYADLLNAAAAELDPQPRLDLLADAERYMLEEAAPIAPIYIYNVVHMYDPDRVHGVSQHPRNLQMFGRVSVSDDN